MKTATVTLTVAIPDDATHVSVSESGVLHWHAGAPVLGESTIGQWDVPAQRSATGAITGRAIAQAAQVATAHSRRRTR